MGNQWENFLKNLGEWQGSFTQVSPDGEVLSSTASLLSLEGLEGNSLVRFRLQRFGPEGLGSVPISDYQQDYRGLGRQIIFFDTGAFSKGSLQLGPFSEFGAEYGFVADDRRLRLVQLYDRQAHLSQLTLIREFRRGSNASERPALTLDQLLGCWQGQAFTAYPDWRSPEVCSTRLEIQILADGRLQQTLSFGDRHLTSTARIEDHRLYFEDNTQGRATVRQILLLPDGASSNTPMKLYPRQQFFVEAGWLLAPDQRQRLIRHYDQTGAWVSSTHVIEHKV